MRRCRINLPNRCYRLIRRVAHRVFGFEGLQAANRKGRAAVTRKPYCGNLLWQSGLALLAMESLNCAAFGCKDEGGFGRLNDKMT